MKNSMIDIPISDKLNDRVNESLNQIENQYRRNVRKKIITGVCTAAAVFVGGIFICAKNPVLASKIPVLGDIFTKIETNITYSGDYSQKAEVLTKEDEKTTKPDNKKYTVSDSGITITASEVYCDGYSVYATLNIESQKSLGKICSYYTSSFGSATSQFLYTDGTYHIGKDGEEKQLMNNHIEGKQINDTNFIGMIKLDRIKGTNSEKSFNLCLKMNGIGADTEEQANSSSNSIEPTMTEGAWNLTIPVSVDTDSPRLFDPEDKNIQGYGIDTVVVTPYQIIVDAIAPDSSAEYGIAIFNQNGERIEFDRQVGTVSSYPVKGKTINKLFIYISQDSIAAAKETNQKSAEKNAIYKTEIDLTKN